MKPLLYFVCLSMFLMMGCSSDSEEEMNAQALQHHKNGEYEKALTAFQSLQDEYGETPETWQNIAVTAYQGKDYAYAIRAVQNALNLISTTGDNSPATIERREALTEILAMARESEGDLEDATRLYYDLTNAQTTSIRVSAKSRLAQLFLNQGKSDAALAFLLSALKDDERNALTNYNLAKLCNETLKCYDKAYEFYRTAYEHLPDESRQKQIADAEIKRLELNRNDWYPMPAKGNASKCKKAIESYEKAKRSKRFKTAENYAKQALDADPSSHLAAVNLITIAKQNKNVATAIKTYQHAFLIKPNDNDLRIKAEKYAFENKRYEDAIAFLRPVLITKPQQLEYPAKIYQMMNLLVKQKKRDVARAWGEYYLTINPYAPEENRRFIKNLPMYTE
jgi:tetratricopeptide (TPR) repeat protein